MTREELIKILDFLPVAARRAELIQKIVKASEEAGFDTSIAKFIEATLTSSKPKPPQIVTKEGTMHETFKEITESGYDFADCYDPALLVDFISQENGLWDIRPDDMTEQQQRTVRLILMKYRQWRKTHPKEESPKNAN